MKFWWENESDYGDEKTSSSIICNNDETNISSLNVLEIRWRKHISSPNVFKK